MLIGRYERKSHIREMRATWKRVEKYGMFDFKGSTLELQVKMCNKQCPCPDIVLLYARMGLHRYNLLQGTKFELSRVKKYIISKGAGTAVATYYITLVAMDPAAASCSRQTFQTEVAEGDFCRFTLLCNIARIRGETTNGRGAIVIDRSLPEWPAENPFEKYYLVKESDLNENEWIRLYMELAVATTDRNREAKDYDPSKLEIVKVAMDADGEGLNAINAVFYVRYKDLYETTQFGKEALDRFAIVRRRFDEDTQCFSLVGSQVTPSADFQMKALHL